MSKKSSTPPLCVLSDNESTSDLLGFDRYINPLCDLLASESTQTPFTIGLFGSWGSGKSTLLRLLSKRLEGDATKKFVIVEFNPWYFKGEENILIPLLHTIHDTLVESGWKETIGESLSRIGGTLMALGTDLFLKGITAGAVSLDRLEELEERYLQQQNRARSEIRNLRYAMQDIADKIADNDARLVIIIDDLDRCEPNTIIDTLESIKLFLDVRHSFTILAVDKEVIDQGIEIKYGEFEFAKSRQEQFGAEYVEKMIQLPFQLFPLTIDQIEDFIRHYDLPSSTDALVPLLATIVLPNPRKIKRILNILAITINVAQNTQLAEPLKDEIVTRLVVLQVQDPRLYREISKEPRLVKALVEVYTGERNPAKESAFGDFENREEVYKLITEFYRPGTYLDALFKSFEVPTNLSSYFSMIAR